MSGKPSFNAELNEAQKLVASHGSVTYTASSSDEFQGAFSLNPDQLSTLIDPKNPWVLKAIGGPENLAKILVSSPKSGLADSQTSPSEIEQREKVYGKNLLPEKKSANLFKIILLTLNDKVLIILIVAALISLALGLYETFGEPPEHFPDGSTVPKVDWVEGVAILVAVAIVTLVGSVNDWQKERQFVKLNRKKEERMIEVVRNSSQQQIGIESVQVGDILCIQTGDILPVDGVCLESNDVECDESSVTGESDTMKKVAAVDAMKTLDATGSTKHADCLLISGAKVLQGSGKYIVTAVGSHSMYGKTMMSLRHGTEETPLQEKLNRIADGIAKFGVWAALALFIVLFIRFLVQISGHNRLSELNSSQKGNKFMDIFIVAITIIVVAVPEGLPLAVTLALAFATTRMVKDNCLVRVLKSCETMGGATSICSDKTGTLTQNKMTVVEALVAGEEWKLDIIPDPDSPNNDEACSADKEVKVSLQGHQTSALNVDSENDNIPTDGMSLLNDLVCVNSTVYEDHENPSEIVGSKTEIALVNYARLRYGLRTGSLQSYRESRQVKYVLPFDSSRKYMMTIIQLDKNHYRMLVKGAAEIISGFSSNFLTTTTRLDAVSLDKEHKSLIYNTIDSYADSALRCIAVAYKDFQLTRDVEWSEMKASDWDVNELTFAGLYGIQDPLRPGVRDSIMQCQRAGVCVRMVTGDNLRTARAISINARIITGEPDEDAIVMEGPEFRKLEDYELLKIAPRIRVLARSSPQDKRRLVEFLKSQGETVAVTGDGTNDAPALRLADVGFSMGIAGTEVAKEASDIIIMDDNFSSIVKALKWGRTVNDAVKKFLQFQLTVNVTAVTLTFVSAVASSDNESVLTAVQLLWVNLIMDTLAALALATDAPTDEVLDRLPDNRKKSLITPTMWKMIFGQALFQLGVTFVLHFAGRQIFNYPEKLSPTDEKRLSAFVFNTFVWMQFFNMFVNRRLDNKQNLLNGITRNLFFPLIAAIIGGFQVLIMFVGGAAFYIEHNTGPMWATAIVCGFVSIPVGMFLRLIPDRIVMVLFPRKLWHWFMFCLDTVEDGFLWLMTPVSWLYNMIAKGCKRIFGANDDDEAPEEHHIEKHLHPREDKGSEFRQGYEWVPGIEKSIADISFVSKVRGGRSKQLNRFFEKNPKSQVGLRSNHDSRNSIHSMGSDSSTLAAFMAPMVVGGAVGGWAPHRRNETT